MDRKSHVVRMEQSRVPKKSL